MLGHLSRTPALKCVHLLIDSPPLHALLQALLMEWGYQLTADTTLSPLLVISEGLTRPTGFDHALTLSRSHFADRHRLCLPLKIETLYLALENHFHRTPRNHIRINLEWPIQVRVRNQQFSTHTLTVADRGIRFASPLELVRDEEMEILVESGSGSYDLHARAVYSLVGKEIGRGNLIEVGAVCVPQSKEVRESIRSDIIGHYLQRVRALLDPYLFDEALQQLDLAPREIQIATAAEEAVPSDFRG